MLLSLHTHLKYTSPGPCSLLLQIEAARGPDQTIEASTFSTAPHIDWRPVAGEEGVGVRRWGVVDSVFDCEYTAQIRVNRPDVALEGLVASPLTSLPDDVTKYLMPSRYCFPEDFLSFVPWHFGGLSGGALIAAVAEWIRVNFTYDNAVSHSGTTATDSFNSLSGVCRDYAHVLIAIARSVGIPARMVSGYGPDVSPQDFHAFAEVFLQGQWHMVDPTGMARPSETIRVGVGRDAADVSFMTSYGMMTLINQSVAVWRLG